MAQELRKLIDEYIPRVAMVKPSIDTLIVGELVFVRDENSRGLLIASGGKGEMFIEVIRVENRVYIPASSIKGVLRRVGEAVAKSIAFSLQGLERDILLAHCELENEGVTHLCYDITKLLDMLRDRDSLRLLAERGYIPRDAVEEVYNQLRSEDQADKGIRRLEALVSQLCPVCRVFGGSGLAGKLRILRVEISPEDADKAVNRLTHVSIDRGRRVAFEGALFVEEHTAIEKIRVGFAARNIVPDSTDYKLLVATLRTLKELPLLLGHSKSRGLGWYRLSIAESRIIYIDFAKVVDVKQLVNAILNPFNFGVELKIW
jgi:CRISPR/Cas system CSM-associated protein Csm3 (group 7 of RAMP superfamily)